MDKIEGQVMALYRDAGVEPKDVAKSMIKLASTALLALECLSADLTVGNTRMTLTVAYEGDKTNETI